ncbi:hypothetical protein [Robertmurraya massiliosenegalensis]|uniref:hypothetical protein n=1 Tax=Robertmurraya massiliosenegalensis TaxID=1287657 RepID=UPI0012B5FB6A|nr:hypothetical protein [Robertmurraya massiliosenegalensis]
MNYFEKEINELGMYEAFETWKKKAWGMVNSSGAKSEFKNEDLAKKFEIEMNGILSEL